MFDSIYQTAGENGLFVFLLLTVALGGAAAWRTGRAVAEGWGPLWPLAGYVLVLAAAVRFLHYALFDGPLTSLPNFIVDAAVLGFFALAGHRARRAGLMTEQYPWLFSRAGPFAWRRRSATR